MTGTTHSRTPPEIDISVCVPVYNEEDSVGPMHAAITAALDGLGRPYEMVFVDDGSRDATIPRLKKIAETDPRLTIVRFQRNYGQTAAMMAGIDHARGRFLVTMDGDLQNDPADIPMMLEKLEEGYDLVVGWRINRQDKLLSRKVPSKIANWLIGKVTGLPIRDNGCSLKVYRGELIKRVPLYSDMHRFIPAMTLPLGARVAQVGVRHHARQFGESKYGLSRIFKVLLDLVSIKTLLIFARRPLGGFLRLAGLSALCALLAALLIGSDGTSRVVEMAVVGLFGSLSLYLILLGMVTGAIFQDGDASLPPDPVETPPEQG
ncbi:glycosyltransferase family 2 protein [Ruegeria sp. 2012CJ41-6]|uniref:Glycosyltransferase family 2 protein n=1 Tax=Ruegeria spongiae TaxID=2942209 RepID=A0ABT0Q6Y8_9RHOB|nr:glycosyltransferase family 2 protein [Ruegeria spongiae]MCL6285639.1 glycosyltransferase family 2 protein [Ruegeria spongiae]